MNQVSSLYRLDCILQSIAKQAIVEYQKLVCDTDHWFLQSVLVAVLKHRLG